MNEPKKYVKMSELVGDSFIVDKVWGYHFQKWDQAEGRMIRSDNYSEGFEKKYDVETNKGKLTISASQLGQCLAAVQKNGEANLINEHIEVASNGKDGKEIRYFLRKSFAKEAAPAPATQSEKVLTDDEAEETVNLDGIPF